jgi:hypothetical protein
MQLSKLQPFFQRACVALISCPACGQCHTVEGLVTPTEAFGDVALDQRVYSPSAILAIRASDGPCAGGSCPPPLLRRWTGWEMELDAFRPFYYDPCAAVLRKAALGGRQVLQRLLDPAPRYASAVLACCRKLGSDRALTTSPPPEPSEWDVSAVIAAAERIVSRRD